MDRVERLVFDMLSSKACEGHAYSCFYNSIAADELELELLEKMKNRGLAVSTEAGKWQLTKSVAASMVVEFQLFSPMPLFTRRADLELDKLTLLELMLDSENDGWTLSEATPGRYRKKFYNADGEKVYYKASRHHWIALLTYADIASKGNPNVYHRQVEAYYEALVCLPSDKIHLVLPGKKAPYYRHSHLIESN